MCRALSTLPNLAGPIGARMVFLSTEQVFNGNTAPGPYSEEDVPQPNTVYGRNKLEAETRVAKCPWSRILRFAWTFGFPERNLPLSPNLFWEVVWAAARAGKLKVPVNELRSLMYIYDIIDQFKQGLRPSLRDVPRGKPQRVNRYEIACEILRLIGAEHRTDELIEPDSERYRDKPRDVRLDVSKISRSDSPSRKPGRGSASLFASSGWDRISRDQVAPSQRLVFSLPIRITSSGLICQYSGRKSSRETTPV